MLRLRKDSKRAPFGGHHFTDHGVTFRGENLQEVVKKLSEFRLGNAIPIGSPEQEVLRFYGENWPYLVERTDGSEPERNGLYDQYREAVHEMWRRPPKKFLTTKEASLRWEVCKTCPFNTKHDWKETNESAEIARRAFVLRRGMDVPDSLGFCALHKADIPALSFLAEPKVYASDAKHPGCWVL
jgi:hypothetical protein